MQFNNIMEELLEYEEQCNISISFFKFQDHYSKEIKIKAYHVGDPVPFFVRRYFVEDASERCVFLMSEKFFAINIAFLLGSRCFSCRLYS